MHQHIQFLRFCIFAAFLCVFVAPVVHAATPVKKDVSQVSNVSPGLEGKEISAVRLKAAPKIDGLLSPGEWDGAETVSGFHQTRPLIGADATYKTIVYVAHDDDFLYVGARMFDPDPSKIIANRMVQGNRTFGDDRFRVVLSPFNNQRSGFRFGTNPNGIRQEALAEGPEGFNFDWQAIWQTAATVDEEGWVAEIAIPFKTINFDPNQQDWGISFARNIARLGEEAAWTSFNGRNSVQALGVLKGVNDINQGVGLDIIGNVIPRLVDNEITGREAFEFNPAVDIFYKITPSLTGVFTANTDFSTTDVDDQIVNLSRFSVLFPERRDFFLQDADIFQFADLGGNGNPFFSRTIGLDQSGAPLNLIAGGKVAGRVGDLNLGVIDVVQEQGDGTGEANLFVGRASYNIFDYSQVGMILTHGDPVNGRGAMSYGVDLTYRRLDLIPDVPVEVNLYYLDTFTPEVDRSETFDGATATYGISGRIDPQEGYEFFGHYRVIGSDFNPALGFVNRAGTEDIRLFAARKWRPTSGPIQLYEVSARYFIIRGADGEVQSESFWARPLEITNRRGDRAEMRIERRTEVLTQPFEILDGVSIPEGRYNFDRMRLTFDTDSSRDLGLFATTLIGEFFSGDRFDIELGLRYSPNRFLTIETSVEQSELDLAEGSATTRVASFRSDVAFDSHWSWITRVQYDNVSDTVGINSRLRYNRQAGQDFFLVVNQGFRQIEEMDEFEEIRQSFQSINTDVAVRLTYTWRF